jgi:hypothetical protein
MVVFESSTAAALSATSYLVLNRNLPIKDRIYLLDISGAIIAPMKLRRPLLKNSHIRSHRRAVDNFPYQANP